MQAYPAQSITEQHLLQFVADRYSDRQVISAGIGVYEDYWPCGVLRDREGEVAGLDEGALIVDVVVAIAAEGAALLSIREPIGEIVGEHVKRKPPVNCIL